MYGGRRRYRDYEARGRSLDSPGLSSLVSEAQDSSLDSASLSLLSSSLLSTTASSSSTRDRVLQVQSRYASKYFFGSPDIFTGSLADDAGGPEAGPETRPHLVPGQEAEQLGGQVSLASQQGQILR